MGVLETLGAIDQRFKDGVTEPLLDNDAFSVQNTVRGTIEAATGAGEDGDKDFAEDSARFFKKANAAIATPGRMVGEATDGTVLDNPISNKGVAGAELGYEYIVEDLGAIAYGTATGANVRTNEPTHATDDYRPGIIDTGEIILTAGSGGTAKVATGAAKGLGKGGAKVAAKGGSKAGMSLLGKGSTALSGIFRSSDEATDAARAADDTVSTSRSLDDTFKAQDSKQLESRKLPDHKQAKATLGSVSDAVSDAPTKTYAALGAGSIGLGWLGLADKSPFPQGYNRIEELTAAPGGWIVEETDTEGTVLGYWVVTDASGLDVTYLTSGGSTASTAFPTSQSPPFASEQQARTAFESWASAWRDSENSGAANDNSSPPTSKNGTWGESRILKPMDNGWYLVEQDHTTEDKSRYMVVGKTPNGLIFVNDVGTATTSPVAYKTLDEAAAAYEKWLESRSGPAPDPSLQRPDGSDITERTKDTGTGSSALGGISGLVIGGGALVALIILLTRVL